MQREPRRAAVQACVREQRALSVPKKEPGGDFHSIGPNANAAGRARPGLLREPREGALHGSTERTLCYEVLCSVKPHSAWASFCTAARNGTETDRKRGERQTVRWNRRNTAICYIDSGEKSEGIWEREWSQTQCSYLYSQYVFSKLCCQSGKASECWTGSSQKLTAVTLWVLLQETLELPIV